MRSVTVDCVRDETRFATLRDPWNALLERAQRRSVFLRHEWFDAAWCWLQREPQPAQLMILCAYEAGALIGICPLMLRRRRLHWLPARTVELVTVPDTQLAEVIVAPHDLETVAGAVATYLASQQSAWDLLDLRKLPAGSPTVAALDAALTAHALTPRRSSDGTNAGITLDASWERYYSRRSRRLKKGNNLVDNKLHRAFRSIEIRRLPHDYAPEQIDAALADIEAISAASWKASTGLTLDQPAPRAFFARLNAHALRNGWLSAFVLYLDGSPVAMEYQLAHGGDVHALRADFRADRGEHSPGTYLNQKLLETLFASTRGHYWMGPGRNPYKARWAEDEEPLLALRAFSRGPRGRALAAVEHTLVRLYRALRAPAAGASAAAAGEDE